MESADAASQISETRMKRVITIGGDDFYILPLPKQRLPSSCQILSNVSTSAKEVDFRPATVLSGPEIIFSSVDLEATMAHLASVDDVWNRGFADVLIFRALESIEVDLPGNFAHTFIDCTKSILPNGPYVIQISTGYIFAVSKLFEDYCHAFVGKALGFNLASTAFGWLDIEGQIAVPSRMYYERTSTKPLAGLRFAVKDIIDIAGLETGCGNRNFRSLYPKKTTTALCIQQLIDAGAILVGKTMTTQFAQGQEPVQWFDYMAPFNPRGDTYQKPSSSSAGSAVASAAYSWIDFTVGTDTGGSIRHPAGVCGVYGMRPSINTVSTKGVYSVSSFLDTIGVFARSATILEAASKSLLDPVSSSLLNAASTTKYKLLYLSRSEAAIAEDSSRWFPHPGYAGKAGAAEEQLETFVQKLESHLGCSRIALSLEDLWRETRPTGQNESLSEATCNIYTVLTTYDCVRTTIDPFIADHKAACSGRAPFIDPIVKARLDYGRNIPDTEYDEAVSSAQMFKAWVLDTFFQSPTTRVEPTISSNDGNNATGNATPLLIFPQNRGVPDPRTKPVPPDADLFFHSFSPYSLSYLSGCPDITVPIGEVPFQSSITGTTEWLPVSVSILGPVGSDMQLLNLLSEMQESRLLREVKTGRRAFG